MWYFPSYTDYVECDWNTVQNKCTMGNASTIEYSKEVGQQDDTGFLNTSYKDRYWPPPKNVNECFDPDTIRNKDYMYNYSFQGLEVNQLV